MNKTANILGNREMKFSRYGFRWINKTNRQTKNQTKKAIYYNRFMWEKVYLIRSPKKNKTKESKMKMKWKKENNTKWENKPNNTKK